MKIFNDSAYINTDFTANKYKLTMLQSDPLHMGPADNPFSTSGNRLVSSEKRIGAEGITRAGTFQTAMLQALDKVSGAQQQASFLSREAIINPDSVDAHDLSIAQAEASMSLSITRNILNRLVQAWRDLINTR